MGAMSKIWGSAPFLRMADDYRSREVACVIPGRQFMLSSVVAPSSGYFTIAVSVGSYKKKVTFIDEFAPLELRRLRDQIRSFFW
jgi:hypothetical protein